LDIARYIEHTNLSPIVTIKDIDKLVDDARQYNFFGVCVPPFWVKRAKREIGTDDITLITVAGFPLGYNMTETKLDEIMRTIDNGADEIDVVWNTSSFKTGIPWTKIEIAKCGKLIHDNQKLMKVIVDMNWLAPDEIIAACRLCADAGADFICSSTDLNSYRSNPADLRLMRSALSSSTGIKACGNIITNEDVNAALACGIDRIGTSHALGIMQDYLTTQTNNHE
jgi:deoxyribose-phosphate aldolase